MKWKLYNTGGTRCNIGNYCISVMCKNGVFYASCKHLGYDITLEAGNFDDARDEALSVFLVKAKARASDMNQLARELEVWREAGIRKTFKRNLTQILEEHDTISPESTAEEIIKELERTGMKLEHLGPQFLGPPKEEGGEEV